MKKKSQTKKRHEIFSSVMSTLRVMIITIFSVSAVIYLIYQRHSVDNTMRQIDKLVVSKKQIQMENSRLQRQINELSNYSRISKIAIEELGLIPAKKHPIVVVADEKVLYKNKINKNVALNNVLMKKELFTSKAGL